MLKYLSKFASDILPSVAATIIGAYIVNHYISAKPAPDAPAAAVSLADPKSAGSKPAEMPADVANIPAAGVRAKGISEKAIFDRPSEKTQEKPQEKPQEKSSEKSAEKSAEKPADKPAETASIPADTRRHSPAPREKTAIRTIPLTAPVTAPAPVQPAVSTVAPAAPAPTVEAALPPEEHRDANDLARAAIERLRGGNENSPRAQEAARTPNSGPRVIAAPQGQPLAILRPLPPPITVSTPPDEAAGPSQTQQPYPTSARIDDPRRPTPPADIPSAQPFDLRAEAEPPVREHRNVAEDMLSAAKSVFHAVLPQ